eukprot:m.13240 g.13240  ORF g.13240 m.13240 type:complete len:63 (+) comp24583_c0_seq2:715-903(+)
MVSYTKSVGYEGSSVCSLDTFETFIEIEIEKGTLVRAFFGQPKVKKISNKFYSKCLGTFVLA